MKNLTFQCKCGYSFTLNFNTQDKLPFSVLCQKCKNQATRCFNNINLNKENDNVSAAIQTMLFSTLPSGKNKVNV